tara:strand:- start:472 stop:678 length:207 start_codon:yes stop_codon:yes gene_type:complete
MKKKDENKESSKGKKVTRADILKRFEELGMKIEKSSGPPRTYITFARSPKQKKSENKDADQNSSRKNK